MARPMTGPQPLFPAPLPGQVSTNLHFYGIFE